MRRVTPKVFVVGETKVDFDGMKDYLKRIGAEEWLERYTRGKVERPLPCPSNAELLSEFYGRLCYRSWKPGMNANVTKVREGNDVYLDNVLAVKHGSVIEHAVVNLVFADVSRVFTHELVRHRAGAAFSQESLRFVRLTDLGLWLPPEAEKEPWLVEMFEKTFKTLEALQLEMATRLGLDNETVQFSTKKVLTSLMRRLAPEGMSTTIGASFNFRALRHVLTMRTPKGAESEMRVVMDQLGPLCKERWPNLFADFTREADGTWTPKYEKV